MTDLSFSAPKLEPFLLMAKSTKGAAAAKLIENATAAAGVYVFAELLDLPNIEELRTNAQYASHLSLLELFSYGTYEEYKANKASLPPLNEAQITKLKHLSIVSLATQRRILPYPYLLSYLDITSIRVLEDLIIDAIYNDVIKGKLDQKEQHFEVEYIMGRDLKPGDVENLLKSLQNWCSRTSHVLSTLDAKIADVTAQDNAAKSHLQEYQQYRQNLVADILAQKSSSGANRRHTEEMDWDPTGPSDQGKGGNGVSLGGKKRGGGGTQNTAAPNSRKRNRG